MVYKRARQASSQEVCLRSYVGYILSVFYMECRVLVYQHCLTLAVGACHSLALILWAVHLGLNSK
jgi:hypothetical protein